MPPAVIRVQKGRAFLFFRLNYKKKKEAECFNLLIAFTKPLCKEEEEEEG